MGTLDDVETRVVLRPLASPLPLGFLALAVATFSFATVQIGWVRADQGSTIAYGVLILTVPLQLLASVMGFLARDPVAATGMGILSGTWGAICLATLTSPVGATSAGLGVLLLCSAGALLVPGVAALTQGSPCRSHPHQRRPVRRHRHRRDRRQPAVAHRGRLDRGRPHRRRRVRRTGPGARGSTFTHRPPARSSRPQPASRARRPDRSHRPRSRPRERARSQAATVIPPRDEPALRAGYA